MFKKNLKSRGRTAPLLGLKKRNAQDLNSSRFATVLIYISGFNSWEVAGLMAAVKRYPDWISAGDNFKLFLWPF